ncbi:MAG: LPS export ABC transporter periplasmic protein LptC [Elusimicrobiaceae bacterium]|nr:LPS export ABC transporter periplasmic protein LptC [Elusimicrobiaceae bacterium]
MNKIILITLLACTLTACSSEKSFSPEEEDVQKANQVVIFESKDSQNKWILQAAEVDFEDMEHAVLTHPHLLLREQGMDSAEVTGKRGLLNYSKKLVAIDGDARVHSFKQKATLTTDRFFYDVDKDRIWSDKKTIVIRGNTKMTAQKGIETDSKLRKIEFKEQITQLPDNPDELREAVQ